MQEYQKNRKNQKKQISNSGSGLGDYARYSGLAFEMIAIILGTSFGGVKLDEHFGTKPLFTVILSLFGVGASLYIVLKGILKKHE
jgi:F0F1-type ATP synthase assembly protein I